MAFDFWSAVSAFRKLLAASAISCAAGCARAAARLNNIRIVTHPQAVGRWLGERLQLRARCESVVKSARCEDALVMRQAQSSSQKNATKNVSDQPDPSPVCNGVIHLTQ